MKKRTMKKILGATLATVISMSTAPFTLQSITATDKPHISIENYDTPHDVLLTEGDKYVIYGTITSDVTMDSVSVDICTGEGKDRENIIHIEKEIDDKTFDLHTLDNQIEIDKLPASFYDYSITVDTAYGSEEIVFQDFYIIEENNNVTISNYTLPHPMKKGDVCVVKGNIEANFEKLSEVHIIIYDENDKIVLDESANVDAYTYDINNLDDKITFDKLDTGEYIYQVQVVYDNGQGLENVIEQPFIIK